MSSCKRAIGPIERKVKNLQLTLHPSQGQQNVFFFQAIINFTILDQNNFTQSNTAQEQLL